MEVDRLDTGAMLDVVSAARDVARPGDTVLLAPVAASIEGFRDYRQCGERFADPVLGAGGRP